jgi:hypothetical protein
MVVGTITCGTNTVVNKQLGGSQKLRPACCLFETSDYLCKCSCYLVGLAAGFERRIDLLVDNCGYKDVVREYHEGVLLTDEIARDLPFEDMLVAAYISFTPKDSSEVISYGRKCDSLATP